jgi:hypothetical protein
MRRIISVLTVMAIMVAMVVAMAMPAFAQIPPPPNCESGQFRAALNKLDADGPRDFGQFLKHGGKAIDCLRGNPPGEGQ